jgi:ABC-type multidrug transport system fused ATPase/permease subunit
VGAVGGPAAISLQDVTFRYPGAARPALDGISLDVPAGALVAVTGAVGSGKSALARVLLGSYPLESGRVLLDGVAVQTIAAAERAARAGYFGQDAHLFSGSVRDNILLGAPPAALDAALRCAVLDDDLRGFPAGLDTDIGELGIQVSGGQRQRIGLARAMAASGPRSPGLLILDDPFSAVDVDTEARIIAGLRESFGLTASADRRATIVLCSHRLAAFPQADLVVVLDQGRIVQCGTHLELLAAGGLYARIYQAQRRLTEAAALLEEAV